MPNAAMLYAHATVVGLVAGTIAVALHVIMTGRRPSFQARPGTVTALFGQSVVIALGGPLVLMRNAIRGRFMDGRPLPFLAASAVIASLWCYLSGAFLLRLAVVAG